MNGQTRPKSVQASFRPVKIAKACRVQDSLLYGLSQPLANAQRALSSSSPQMLNRPCLNSRTTFEITSA
jgi:hypothetical protein